MRIRGSSRTREGTSRSISALESLPTIAHSVKRRTRLRSVRERERERERGRERERERGSGEGAKHARERCFTVDGNLETPLSVSH